MSYLSINQSCFIRTIYCFSPVNKYGYYLTGDLAILERQVLNYISNQLRQNGLQQLSGPDMVKRFIAVSFLCAGQFISV
jgi:hypothetical protein